jgi:hypothetical protein
MGILPFPCAVGGNRAFRAIRDEQHESEAHWAMNIFCVAQAQNRGPHKNVRLLTRVSMGAGTLEKRRDCQSACHFSHRFAHSHRVATRHFRRKRLAKRSSAHPFRTDQVRVSLWQFPRLSRQTFDRGPKADECLAGIAKAGAGWKIRVGGNSVLREFGPRRDMEHPEPSERRDSAVLGMGDAMAIDTRGPRHIRRVR